MDQHLTQLIPFIVIGFAIVTALGAIARLLQRRRPAPYERVEHLFSAAERSFLGVLDDLFGNDCRILGKIRLGDIIRPRKELSNSARTSAFNRISGKHVDFAICDLRTLQVIGVIELDDSSHKSSSRREADQFVNSALAAAGVPIVRIPARRGYSPAEIREQCSVLFVQNQ